jgi:hypothetical protein
MVNMKESFKSARFMPLAALLVNRNRYGRRVDIATLSAGGNVPMLNG